MIKETDAQSTFEVFPVRLKAAEFIRFFCKQHIFSTQPQYFLPF